GWLCVRRRAGCGGRGGLRPRRFGASRAPVPAQHPNADDDEQYDERSREWSPASPHAGTTPRLASGFRARREGPIGAVGASASVEMQVLPGGEVGRRLADRDVAL